MVPFFSYLLPFFYPVLLYSGTKICHDNLTFIKFLLSWKTEDGSHFWLSNYTFLLLKFCVTGVVFQLAGLVLCPFKVNQYATTTYLLTDFSVLFHRGLIWLHTQICQLGNLIHRNVFDRCLSVCLGNFNPFKLSLLLRANKSVCLGY